MKCEEQEVVVIGAGVSGLVAAKCLRDDGFKVTILERTSDIGGLWTFRENDYGVMRCTHINVSKYNYAFSDFPFPENVPDYPHHSDMARYIKDYAKHFGLMEAIHFNVSVNSVEQTDGKWRINASRKTEDGSGGSEERTYVCSYLAVSTGHHAKPSWPKFEGEETFEGKIAHAVDYKDPMTNDCAEKRVLVVGIGNSAVDVAVDCTTVGRCPSVTISTRSGAWVIPNYIFGLQTDLYACRFFFLFPRWLANNIMAMIITLMTGSPWKWGLNPKMKPLETQPTVSPTLLHHIQRGNIKIMPNIAKIMGRSVQFVNGVTSDFDRIIYCTGYKIDLPYLPTAIKEHVLNEDTNEFKLYKNMFTQEFGHKLAFIGFVQPASGGIITMSETQARWFSKLCKGVVKLPSKQEMVADMEKEKKESQSRWYQSARHTLQKDPTVYNDEIASFIGAKPSPLMNPSLAWRLIFSSGGASQWRLNGPNKWEGAAAQVRKTPLPALWNMTGLFILALLFTALVLFGYTLFSCLQ
ncbi:flavin-containing monooxygenase 5-like [Physella acuta]|uniref:flavin-containing monooxygenase 5-like n=1 Tax=Physella acuta TaxID=109671 RepID=UPI0027DC03D5|nr:flavin-containing monooxygenase 5-like [Physella acuta]XP_059160640.1 flavin-containing monooxygenase 5-like [Physella acuta]